MNSGELKSNNAGFFQSPKLISLVLLVVFVVGLSAGAVLSGSDFISNSGDTEFSISVDNEIGTNKFILIEVDEGDNDEEVVTEHILQEFAFEASDRGGLITWDFSDGFTATGNEATHSCQTWSFSCHRGYRISGWKGEYSNNHYERITSILESPCILIRSRS